MASFFISARRHWPLLGIFVFACSNNGDVQESVIVETIIDSIPATDTTVVPEPYIVDTLEQRIIDAGLINIQDSIPGILVDLKYATEDNFMGQNVYGNMKRAYLQPDAVLALKKSQLKLKELDSTLTLLVYDAVRPRSVQRLMWDILDMPASEKGKFVANPVNGSIHNYGCAVDITIANSDGLAFNMGAGYDDPAKIAYPSYEKHYLDSGMLTLQHIENRELLRKVMRAGGFWGIGTEWWHFNLYAREVAAAKYAILE